MAYYESVLRLTLPPGQSAFLWGPRKAVVGQFEYLQVP